MAGEPKISFLCPLRWFDEDKGFLEENLLRMIRVGTTRQKMHPTLIQAAPMVVAYSVLLKIHAYQPINLTVNKATIRKALSKVFPGAKMLEVSTFFVQKNSSSSLPVIEFQVFHN